MKRYCENCKCNYDFKITNMSDMDNLICPSCGKKVGRESRAPKEADQAEEVIAAGLSWYYTFKYYFYMFFAILGIVFYALDMNKGVYIVTGICLVMYVVRLLLGFGRFFSGIYWIPIGAAISFYFVDKSMSGICLGILVVFAIRHMLKAFGYKILGKLIRWGNS